MTLIFTFANEGGLGYVFAPLCVCLSVIKITQKSRNRLLQICCEWSSSEHLLSVILSVWFKYDFGQKYHVPQVQPGWGLNSWPPDHDSTFHVTETPITTRPSVTSKRNVLPHYLRGLRWFQMHGLSDRLMHWQLICLVQVRLWTEVPRTLSSARSGLELMTSRSWQYISCHWDGYNH